MRVQGIAVSQTDVFALKNSGLEPFLFAEIGPESNGSRLTVLSALARLGLDPWAEAARLVTMPKAASIASLAGSLGRMPLAPQAIVDARVTAARLVLLLPVQNTLARPTEMAQLSLGAMPKWLPMTVLYCVLALGMGLSVVMAPHLAEAPAAQVEPHQ